MKEAIAITGAAGLIGSSLTKWVLKNTEYNVVGIDDLSGGFLGNLPMDEPRLIFHKADAADSFLENIFRTYNVQYCFHMACYAAEGLSPFIRKFNYQNNIIATANVVNACIKNEVERIIFLSSMAVYGEGNPPFREEDPCCPVDPYGVGKFASELDIMIAGTQHGLDWCIVRPHNVYGKNQNIFDPYRNFIGIAIYKALVGDPVTIYGDGEQRRAFTDVDDILEPLWRSCISKEASKQVINLGGIKEYSINEAAKIVSELSGAEIIHLPPRHEVRHAYSTWEKSVNLLGFEHRTDLIVGIAKMWHWAQTVKMRPRFIWPSYEIEEGLYEFWQQESLKDGYYKK